MKIGFLATGLKGLWTLQHLENMDIAFVTSYGDCLDSIKEWCIDRKIDFNESRKYLRNHEVEKVFVIGWQYLLDTPDHRLVVLHDSYFPELKGFGPTVTSLISGQDYLGATAFVPTNEIDSGPYYLREKISIEYPIKIKNAFQLLAQKYAEMIRIIIEDNLTPNLEPPEWKREATYSIWRDSNDYKIDWNWDAKKIKRFVDAVGDPYDCAEAFYDNQSIRIVDVEVIENKKFIERHPGKIWQIKDGIPEVICGTGMIRILRAMVGDRDIKFNKIKRRLFETGNCQIIGH